MNCFSTSAKVAFLLLAVMGATEAIAADLPAPVVIPPDAPPAYFPFYVHIGAAGLFPDTDAKVKVLGNVVPGAKITIPPTTAAALEAGYRFTPNWAVSLSGGIPPTSLMKGAGTIAPYGKLNSTLAGPIALTAHYHFLQFGSFQPYIGGGATYLVVFGSKGAALSDPKVDPALGAVGQIGTDVMLTDRLGLFFDLKKAYLRTNASASLGAYPVKAAVKLDPLALTGGVTVRF